MDSSNPGFVPELALGLTLHLKAVVLLMKETHRGRLMWVCFASWPHLESFFNSCLLNSTTIRTPR